MRTHETARYLLKHGFAPIPVKPDGTKQPATRHPRGNHVSLPAKPTFDPALFKFHREAANVRREQIALYLGISAHAVQRWELGYNTPSLENLAAACQLLDVKIDEVLS